MRRAGPILILLIGILALVIDLLPGLQLARLRVAPTGWRTVETKLGLDLEGGLRVEYQALPVDGKSPTPATWRSSGHRRAPGQPRPASPSRSSPPRAPTASSSSCRASPTRRRSASSSAQTGRLDFVPTRLDDRRPRARSLDPKQYPPLFSGDQVSSATVGTDQNGRPAVDFVLKPDGSSEVRRLHGQERRQLLRDHPRQRGHLGAGHPERRSRTGTSRSPVAGWPASTPRTPRTSSRSSSSARCRSRSGALERDRSARRWAASSSTRAVLAGAHRDLAWSSRSCSSTTGCRASWRASRSSTTRS